MFVAVAVALFERVRVLVLTAVIVVASGIPEPVMMSPTSKFVPSSTVTWSLPDVVSAVESVNVAGEETSNA